MLEMNNTRPQGEDSRELLTLLMEDEKTFHLEGRNDLEKLDEGYQDWGYHMMEEHFHWSRESSFREFWEVARNSASRIYLGPEGICLKEKFLVKPHGQLIPGNMRCAIFHFASEKPTAQTRRDNHLAAMNRRKGYGRRQMKPIFEYRDWKTSRPDDEERAWSDWSSRMICPVPECLLERNGEGGYQGRVACQEENHGDGECPVAGPLAIPCSQHQYTFTFEPGWYGPFESALLARQESIHGALQPKTCQGCGNRYTEFLWGHPQTHCPECTYVRNIILGTNSSLYELSMILGAKFGLGIKAKEYENLPPQEEKENLVNLLRFIRNARETEKDRTPVSLDPYCLVDLEEEYDQLHPRPEGAWVPPWLDTSLARRTKNPQTVEEAGNGKPETNQVRDGERCRPATAR